MNRPQALISLLFFALATSFAPGQCAGLSDLIKAYESGQYNTAIAIGEKVVAKDPTDYSTRYYLANTYVLLHKNDQAIEQYRICANSKGAGQVKEYSMTALERLLKQKEQLLEKAQKDAPPQNKDLTDFQKRVHAQAREEEATIRKEWNQALQHLDGSGNNRGWSGGFNGGFNPFVFNQWGHMSDNNERFRINETYSRRLADLHQNEQSMLTQANCGTGKIRLAPSLSSLKVKNYINYGDESEAADIPVDNPLKAVAKSLADPATKKTIQPSKKGKKPPGTTSSTSDKKNEK